MSARLALLGHPLHQSVSPAIQQAAMAATGIEGRYRLLDVLPEDLPRALDLVRRGELLGCNVTMPYKEAVVGLLDALDEDAAAIRAVNTVTREGASLVGHNTDAYGVRRTIEVLLEGHAPGAASAVVIGAGGTGRSATYGLLRSGFGRIVVYNRHVERAERLVADLSGVAPTTRLVARPLEDPALGDELARADLLLNASSAGLNSDESPLPASLLPPGIRVFDVVYSPRDTRLLRDARAAGAAATANGESMVVHQGARAFELWFGRTAPVEEMMAALNRAMEARAAASAPAATGR